MTMPTFTSREFNREPGRIKRAAADGSVINTEGDAWIAATGATRLNPWREGRTL